MKQQFVLIVALLQAFVVFSQPNHGKIWQHGYDFGQEFTDYNNFDLFVGGQRWSFEDTTLYVDTFTTLINFSFGNSTICDTSGHMVAYTNGCVILDAQHQVLLGSEALGIGNTDCGMGLSYNIRDGVFLPINDTLYDYITRHHDGGIPRWLVSTRCKWKDGQLSLVNINDTLINGPAINKKLSFNLATIRHGNGRDWWLLQPQRHSSNYFLVNYGEQGIIEIKEQAFGPFFSYIAEDGQLIFSPNGQWVARAAEGHNPCLFKFDRCSGTLVDYTELIMSDSAKLAIKGTAFSASGQYLYISVYISLQTLPLISVKLYHFWLVRFRRKLYHSFRSNLTTL